MSMSPEAQAQDLVRQGKFRTIQEAMQSLLGEGAQVGPVPQGSVLPQVAGQGARGAEVGPASGRGLSGLPGQVAAAAGGQPPQPTPGGGAPPPAPTGPSQRPGVYKAAPQAGQDKYGGTMAGNTNAPGVQSNGDDDPWSIGAFVGGTYDPETLHRWYQRAQQGDGDAAYVLREVGFFDAQNRPVFNSADGLEQWAASRKLDRRAAQGAQSPWLRDPENWGLGGQGYRDEADARSAYDAAPWSQNPSDGGASPWRRPQDPAAQTVKGPVGQPRGMRPPGGGDPFGNGSVPFDAPGKPTYGPVEQMPGGGQKMPISYGPQRGEGEKAAGPMPFHPQEIKPDGSTGHSETPMAFPRPGQKKPLEDQEALPWGGWKW